MKIEKYVYLFTELDEYKCYGLKDVMLCCHTYYLYFLKKRKKKDDGGDGDDYDNDAKSI